MLKKGPQTGTGMTEVHKLSQDFQAWSLQTGTGLHYTNNPNSWSFVMDSRANLLALKKAHGGTFSTEVYRLSRASNYQEFDLMTGTPLHYTNNDKSWSFVVDPTNDDLLAIARGPQTGTGMTEVHRLTAADNYPTFDLQTGTPLPYSNNP
jgi:hypothetical protein